MGYIYPKLFIMAPKAQQRVQRSKQPIVPGHPYINLFVANLTAEMFCVIWNHAHIVLWCMHMASHLDGIDTCCEAQPLPE